MNMKIGTNDILKIKAGSSLTAIMDTYEECLSIKQLAYRANKLSKKPDNVKRYSTSMEHGTTKVTITAIPL